MVEDDETVSHPAINIKFNHPNGMSPPRQPLKPPASRADEVQHISLLPVPLTATMSGEWEGLWGH